MLISIELETILWHFFKIVIDVWVFFKSQGPHYFLLILLLSAAAFWVIFTLSLQKIYDRRKQRKAEIANSNIGDNINRTDSFMQAPIIRYAYENEVESMMTLNRSPATRPACLRTTENGSDTIVYGTLNRNNKVSKFIESEEDDFEVTTPIQSQQLFPMTTSSPKVVGRPTKSTMGGVISGANVLQRTRSNLRKTMHIPMQSSPSSSRASTLTRKKKQKTKTFIDDMDSDTEL